ncbi:hypothetical protein CF326_g8333 [Tilletia indica]|nr:hypothetical protein CF326_g8333 [Tilletia indica]
MWFHLHLIPLQLGTEVPSASWPAHEDGYMLVHLASTPNQTDIPSSAAEQLKISFCKGTFFVQQDGQHSSVRINGSPLPIGPDGTPLLQSDLLELRRTSDNKYSRVFTCRVDLSSSSTSTPVFPGPYTHTASRSHPSYAWTDDIGRAVDDMARHHGHSTPCPPLLPAAFEFTRPVITTASLFPRRPHDANPVVSRHALTSQRASPPPRTSASTSPSVTHTSSVRSHQPVSSSSSVTPSPALATTSVLASTLPLDGPSPTSVGPLAPMTTAPPPPVRPGPSSTFSDLSSSAAEGPPAGTSYGDLVSALRSRSSPMLSKDGRSQSEHASVDTVSPSDVASDLRDSSPAISTSNATLCSDPASGALSLPVSSLSASKEHSSPLAVRGANPDNLSGGERLHSARTLPHQLHTAVTACDRVRAAWLQARRTMLAGVEQGSSSLSSLPTPSSALDITLARAHAAWMAARAFAFSDACATACHPFVADALVVDDLASSPHLRSPITTSAHALPTHSVLRLVLGHTHAMDRCGSERTSPSTSVLQGTFSIWPF